MISEMDEVKKVLKQLNVNDESDLTPSKWNKFFIQLKNLIGSSQSKVMEHQTTIYGGDYDPESYSHYINRILFAIRRGVVDYCFRIYQVIDLMRYEHDRLQVQWNMSAQCFEVWLA